jgi:hypothetical protein
MTTTTKAKTPVKKTTSKATTARVTATPSLPNNPFVFEVLDIVSRQKTNSKKVEILRKYEHVALKFGILMNQ